MKLEKVEENLNMFEKKLILIKDFKKKLVDFTNINKQFIGWDYKKEGEKLKDNVGNHILVFILVTLISTPIFVISFISGDKR